VRPRFPSCHFYLSPDTRYSAGFVHPGCTIEALTPPPLTSPTPALGGSDFPKSSSPPVGRLQIIGPLCRFRGNVAPEIHRKTSGSPPANIVLPTARTDGVIDLAPQTLCRALLLSAAPDLVYRGQHETSSIQLGRHGWSAVRKLIKQTKAMYWPSYKPLNQFRLSEATPA
jgi:hypothetical protein